MEDRHQKIKSSYIAAGIGMVFGLLWTTFLYANQEIEFLFHYFSAASWTINSWILKSEQIVNYTTFVYFAILFGLFGYLLKSAIHFRYRVVLIVILFCFHQLLVIHGSRQFYCGLFSALEVFGSRN